MCVCGWVRDSSEQVRTRTAGFMQPALNFARPSFVKELLQQKFRSEVSVKLKRKRIPARVVQLVTRETALGDGA